MAGVGLLALNSEQVLLAGGTREQEPFSTDVYLMDMAKGTIQLKNQLPDGDAFWS